MSNDEVDFSFDDRVAPDYNAVRGHPPDVSERIGEVLATVAGKDALVFEPGVGTGRIALPLLQSGCRVVGADLSEQMLTALADRHGDSRLQLVRCNLEKLPFTLETFDAVVCVHVLHLIPTWQALLKHLVASLKPGGVIILGRDWIDPESFSGQIRNEFRRAVVELSESITAPPGARAFVQTLTGAGAESEDDGAERIAAEWETTLSPRQLLDEIASKDDAESWVLQDELLGRVMQRLEAFAASAWPDVATPMPVKRRFVYSVFKAPIS